MVKANEVDFFLTIFLGRVLCSISAGKKTDTAGLTTCLCFFLNDWKAFSTKNAFETPKQAKGIREANAKFACPHVCIQSVYG
jgi:hypothetical protein